MNAARPAEILRQLERADGSDADLLARFAATKDAGAFAELVRRHGPLVLGVCRRVTGQAQDAEDAFQATFLVLAKKAGSLRNPDLLGNYLYGVAFRVASRARRSALRRRAREVLVSALPDPQAPSPPPAMLELAPILDEELAALPACYRDAIVLCDLRGQSREVAAATLGVPEGTLSSRLASGRKKLAARLTRRGVTLSAATLPVVLTEATAQAVPTELIAKTCGLVANWAGGGAVPTPLSRLAEGGFTVRKMLVFGVLMAAGVAGAVFAADPRDEGPPSDPPAVAARPADAPQPKGEAKGEEKAVAYTNSPKLRFATDIEFKTVNTAVWSKDGQFFAVQGNSPSEKNQQISWVYVWSVEKGEFRTVFGRDAKPTGNLVGFTSDGRELITEKREYSLVSGFHWLKYYSMPDIIDGSVKKGYTPTDRIVNLDLPETRGYAFSADGKTFRTVARHRDANGAVTKLEVLEASAETGKATKSLLKVDFAQHVLAPNGRRLAVLDKDYTKLTVYDLDRDAKQFEYTIVGEKFAEPPLIAANVNDDLHKERLEPVMVFSPDARRLVISRAVGQNVVLNTETGEALPALEGTKEARIAPGAHCFSGDGRLLAAWGTMYKLVKRRAPGVAPGKKGPNEITGWERVAQSLTVWDTQTGKALKSWNLDRHSPQVMFHTTQPLLAILESNNSGGTRIGFWDFAAEVEKK